MQISYDEGNVVLTEVRDFDLAQTLECGQCFHFKKLAEQEYAVCAFHRLLRIRQEKDSVILFDTTMQDYEMIWRDYFDFGRDYGRIKAALLQTDDTLKEAVETMQGVHILQQEFFETLISFIISQNKQIPHIKKIVETLSYQADLLEGIVALRVTGCRKKAAVNPALYAEDAAPEKMVTLQAIPYYAWCNRGMTHMRVWMQE